MKFKISIIVPIYNAEKYVLKCVESIMKQTYANFELLLVDDGSCDKSLEICKLLEKRDSRINLIQQNNSGVSSARNAGINAANGEYVMFIDADDYIDETFLESALYIAEKYEIDFYISGIKMEIWNNNTILKSYDYTITKSERYTVKSLLDAWRIEYPQVCLNGSWCKLYSKAIIDNYNIRFDEALERDEDTYFNLDFLKFANNIYFDKRIFHHYRRINNSPLFNNFCEEIYFVQDKIYTEMKNLMQEMNWYNFAKYNKTCINLLLGCIHHYFQFFKETNVSMRKVMIKIVSRDEQITNCEYKNIEGL